MRSSVSLNSLFNAFGARSYSTIAGVVGIAAVPLIRVTEAKDISSPLDDVRTPRSIRRWRVLGALGDLNLHIPGRAWTRGERLSLARQGYATGSFRLNCSESLFVLDMSGRPLVQTLDSGASGGKYGDMEKPLKDDQESIHPRSPSTNRVQDSDKNRMLHNGPLSADPFRQQSFASRFKSTSSFTFNQRSSKGSGMASSLTFSEGLCNLHADNLDNKSSLASSSSTEFSPSFSLQSFGTGALAKFESIKNFKGTTLFDSWKGRQKRLERKRRPKPLSLSVSLTTTQTIRLVDDEVCNNDRLQPQPSRNRPPNPFLEAFKPRPGASKSRSIQSSRATSTNSGIKAIRRVSLPTEEFFTKLAASISDDPQDRDSTMSVASGLYLIARNGMTMAKRASTTTSLVPQ
ncbi:hypothetical protein SCHPADRAFT_465485 [Schizopora paradoxa]|uniref:Uncharacterized protein n=1 Tax=Schizopora paradoxa TaxID=27342 RepID=A0A0H2S3N5_9AGAM|nr:hypothetical protein SCHPADRAFT_465485 [Schizopora paradoxa]